LLEQALSQFVAGAHWDTRNVINGFVGIKLTALPARLANGIDDFGFQTQQPQFENLKQAAGSGSDNDDICIDHQIDP
jgi:hypothetical protein